MDNEQSLVENGKELAATSAAYDATQSDQPARSNLDLCLEYAGSVLDLVFLSGWGHPSTWDVKRGTVEVLRRLLVAKYQAAAAALESDPTAGLALNRSLYQEMTALRLVEVIRWYHFGQQDVTPEDVGYVAEAAWWAAASTPGMEGLQSGPFARLPRSSTAAVESAVARAEANT